MGDPKQINSREELLDFVRSQTTVGKRTHEQNVLAIFAIARAKGHPSARLHRAADGTSTITIPPEGTP